MKESIHAELITHRFYNLLSITSLRRFFQMSAIIGSYAVFVPAFAEGSNWQFSIQPRGEMGLMDYQYETQALSVTQPTSPTEFSGFNFTQEQFKYDDQLFFIGAGLTVFVNQFFLDFSTLRAFDGSASDTAQFSSFIESVPAFFSADPKYQADFDRNEYAISIGYNVHEQLALFAGYKWATTDFNTKGNGDFFIVDPSTNSTEQVNFSATADYQFKYDGPFIGLAYGIDLTNSPAKGVLSFNVAAAWLDGKVDVKNFASAAGNVDLTPLQLQNTVASAGDTLGLTYGINWRGLTGINGLTYSLGASLYKYDFESDNPVQPDITETALTLKAGIAYSF